MRWSRHDRPDETRIPEPALSAGPGISLHQAPGTSVHPGASEQDSMPGVRIEKAARSHGLLAGGVCYFGSRTLSRTWMTPLSAAMSACVTLEPSIRTPSDVSIETL